jgi:serine/threonine protein kinase
VCRAFEQVPEVLRVNQFYKNTEYYTQQMTISMQKHHSIMSGLSGPASWVMRSHMRGSISVGGASVPALLMDRASSVSVEVKLQQQVGWRPGQQGLGKQLTHSIMRQVVYGLSDVHDHGWAYLDLKPGNIVVCSTAWEGRHSKVRCKLVDFGSAQHVGSIGCSNVGGLPGSPGFISPEWALQDMVSWGADIWALGILLIELRVGRVPREEVHGLLGQDPNLVDVEQLDPLPLRMSKHQAALQGMKQSPKYATLTQQEWAFIECCLAYEREARPPVVDLFSNDFIRYGPT